MAYEDNIKAGDLVKINNDQYAFPLFIGLGEPCLEWKTPNQKIGIVIRTFKEDFDKFPKKVYGPYSCIVLFDTELYEAHGGCVDLLK